MHKRLIVILLIIFGLFLFLGKTINANTNTLVNNIDGASIRKKTETTSQGLRFYAKLEESVKENKHGFYLVYGKTSLSELETKINTQAISDILINGKEIFYIEVAGVTNENIYSVVLTGIPEAGYFDIISVIPFVEVDGKITLANNINERSVASVALKMANSGEEVNDIVKFDSIVKTDKKKVTINPDGNIIISSGLYELNIEKLKEEFIKDLNEFFKTNLKDLVHEEFFLLAKEGSIDSEMDNKDLSNTNLYKFFNDEKINQKWKWLLNYIINECDIYFPTIQAEALLSNGKGSFLFNGAHLVYSIVNFFNYSDETGEYNAIDFTNLSRYKNVKDFNDSIYVDIDSYNLYDANEEIILPAPKERDGYIFNNYLSGSTVLNPGSTYVINEEEELEAIYSLINYSLSFYDGDSVISSLNRTYNVLDEFVLPVYNKDNYSFIGWYDNIDLEGEQVLKIEKGTTGKINLYGRWEEKEVEYVYQITYNLNGGEFTEEVVNEYSINEEVVLPIPVKEGFSFLGWYEDESLSGQAVTKINFGSVFDKTFYAAWEEDYVKPSDHDLVLDAKNALDITYASGDSSSKVTKNITLPTSSIHGTTVSWATSNSAAVTNAGVVTRGNNDVIVTLTATIKLNEERETKTFTIKVLKEDLPEPDPEVEYTITFNLNGGAWPTTGATPGYTNRTTMVTDFLTDFYNFLKPDGVSLTDFIHGPGKTSGFDGMYGLYEGETKYFGRLYAVNSKGVDPSSDKFINQPQYNKWVPLLDLMEEYTALGEQGFWSSTWTGARRIVPFIQEAKPAGAWNHIPIEDVKAITGKIPEALKGSTPGVTVTVPEKYKVTDNDILLPAPEKSGDNFVGWYDNANLYGTPVTKISKGSTGNKVFYAKYSSSVVVDPTLTDAEKLTLAKNDLNITYSSGDSATKVTKNITLKTSGLHSATITWSSSDTGTISNAGVVNRKETNKTVTLTATIKIGSLTETKTFTLTVLEKEQEVFYTITFNLNGGSFTGYKNKNEIAQAFLTDLYEFVNPSDNLNTFIHGNGKTSGFNGTWYSNDEHRNKIFGANIKSGNNNYFLSHSNYQAKWKPMADFMVSFVKVGNPDQDFWASPYTGNMRLWQYFTNVKPGAAWSDEDMNKLPSGLYIIPNYEYSEKSPTITLPTPTKDGFNFLGWYLNANFTGSKVTNIPTGSKGNKTYYAKWEVLQDPAGKTKIAGPARIPLSQAIAWANSKGAAALFIDAAKYYWEYGELTNIRPEVLFAQAAVETLYGKYGGLVKASYNNFAGIKKRYDNSDTSAAFEQFPTRKEGVRGHFNHIAAYIGQLPYGDPHGRYYAVLTTSHAGKVMYVEQLTGTWAMDPNYAPKIIGLLNEMLFFK